MKKRLTSLAVFGVLALYCGAAFAIHCPRGATPGMNEWGNDVCNNSYGKPIAIQGDAKGGCPKGASADRDKWGNDICKSNGENFYRMNGRCPRGAMQAYDSWGNPICRFNDKDSPIGVIVP